MPTAAEKKLSGQINDWLAYSQQYFQPAFRAYLEDLKFHAGDLDVHWDGVTDEWITKDIENYCYSTPEQFFALLTSQLPDASITAGGEGDQPVSHIFQLLESNVETTGHARAAREKAIHDFSVLGLGVLKTSWDGQARGGGNVLYERIDPFSLFLDPGYTTLSPVYDGEYVIEVRRWPLRVVKRLFPQKAGSVRAFSGVDHYLSQYRRSGDQQMEYSASGATLAAIGEFQERWDSGGDEAGPVPRAVVLICYYNDDSTETVEQMIMDETGQPAMDPETGEPVTESVTQPKYPNGRCTIISGSVVLYDNASPYSDFPYAFMPNHECQNRNVTRFRLPYGEVRQIKPIQKRVNKMTSQIRHNAALCSNGIWLSPQGCRDPDEPIQNEPGAVVEYDGDYGKPELVRPAPLPASFFNELSFAKTAIERVSGITLSAMGIPESSDPSGRAIEGLQQASLSRVAACALSVERTIAVSKRQALHIMRQFICQANPERLERIVMPGMELQQVDPTKIQQAMQIACSREDILDIDVVVRPGSVLPHSMQQDFGVAFQLATMEPPRISSETLLAKGGIEDPAAEKRRVDQELVQQAQGQLAQLQAQLEQGYQELEFLQSTMQSQGGQQGGQSEGQSAGGY